jgi:hypothetical protein
LCPTIELTGSAHAFVSGAMFHAVRSSEWFGSLFLNMLFNFNSSSGGVLKLVEI